MSVIEQGKAAATSKIMQHMINMHLALSEALAPHGIKTLDASFDRFSEVVAGIWAELENNQHRLIEAIEMAYDKGFERGKESVGAVGDNYDDGYADGYSDAETDYDVSEDAPDKAEEAATW